MKLKLMLHQDTFVFRNILRFQKRFDFFHLFLQPFPPPLTMVNRAVLLTLLVRDSYYQHDSETSPAGSNAF